MSARRNEPKPAGAGSYPILDEFSMEQRQMIRRLSSEIGSKDEETVYELAAAALWALGLDPIARDSFDRLSNIVLGKDVDSDFFNRINDLWENADTWTKARRAEERAPRRKGRAA